MNDIDVSWSGYYKFSGISFLISAFLFIIGLAISFYQGILLGPAADRLEILAKHQFLFQLSNGTFILTDIFVILGVLGTYLALYKLRKNLILAGTALSIFGAALAVAVRFGVQAEVSLAIEYAKATSDNTQISYIAAAKLLKSYSDIGLIYANLLLFGGGLISGIAMLAGVFSKKVAYITIIYGALGVIGILGAIFNPMFGAIGLLAAIICIIGMVMVGMRLYAIGKQTEFSQEQF